ncbi:hypothetical protein [Paenibacillus beijingensis]|uniref:Lipoprotein n=1 Tax=Paenibacillus beijingensis TaxID=1126833 RepID=A0A0D5NPL1_9BACL|nr:hypothetical protein [Paenibacillus beijingensis]AJY76863.1 hypothetical protein VN24_22750 [Paenibacillus beijingensis]
MNRCVVILLFALIVFVGCSKTTESFEGKIDDVKTNGDVGKEGSESIEKGIDSDPTEKTNKENKSNGEMKAIRDAHEFINVIKEKNAAKLNQLLNTSDLDIEGTKKIIECFEVNFDLNSLSAQINYDGLSMYPEGGQYEFVLVDKNINENNDNEENSLVIRYEKDGNKVFHNPYVRYFPYAEKMILTYLDIIGEGDAIELASFLNADDIEIPIWVAEETISNYKNFLDTSKVTVRYTKNFTFVAEDTNGKEHIIEVIYGDGLMSIKDDLIPDF